MPLPRKANATASLRHSVTACVSFLVQLSHFHFSAKVRKCESAKLSQSLSGKAAQYVNSPILCRKRRIRGSVTLRCALAFS